jgi:phosphatidylinositol glycan class O
MQCRIYTITVDQYILLKLKFLTEIHHPSITTMTRKSSFSHNKRLLRFDILAPLLTLFGLYIFSSAFFLAKRSLPRTSTCQDVASLLRDTLGLTIDSAEPSQCWMPSTINKLVVLVVDALRLDFAQQSFPQSFGKRLKQNDAVLLQFTADPPTVTMQRIKGLTTGSLPTFAEISGNMGGAYVEEDSWIDFLWHRGSRLGFVGDDTWIDLFPSQWKEAHPFPSFNTRDLDTVDNGCLEYLPALLKDLHDDRLDVVVAHFLGVDHVGHTYGPHTEFMDKKLHQMDEVLDATLNQLESSQECILTLVFGDHGMTEGGNHGGGSPEEVGAALFVHASPACVDRTGTVPSEISQMDLVPTVSLGLGLPIPYANLGGLVTELVPGMSGSNATLALALNAAQVWRYLTDYSRRANRLPLTALNSLLQEAVESHRRALSSGGNQYDLASQKYKVFLKEALELGKRVWTRFDVLGMTFGGIMVAIIVIMWFFRLLLVSEDSSAAKKGRLEGGLTVLFVIFTCGVLTFGNSYIEQEQAITVFCMAAICVALAAENVIKVQWWVPLVIPAAARIQDLLIHGHGLDPSIILHASHHSFVFLASLILLGALCVRLLPLWQGRFTLLTLMFTAHSWWEKRQPDSDRNGYMSCRVALVLWVIDFLAGLYSTVQRRNTMMTAIQVAIGIMLVTGPSTATTMVLFSVEVWALRQLEKSSEVSA